ncbi:cupin [Octadecabacter sp. SW4]|uniref:cupin n=1 Tax=Octadecabacter sp. SW4 TaxID=2602067 RepID=UPI0020C7BE03|nr:cupin [Octadecabacter sp. SW4]
MPDDFLKSRLGKSSTSGFRTGRSRTQIPVCSFPQTEPTFAAAHEQERCARRRDLNMRFHRLYSDAQGESHWQDVDVELRERTFAPPAKAIEISTPETARQTMFLRLRAGWDEPIHPTPVAQKLVCLAGSVRVTASDGAFRDIGPGDVWHMEDKHGKGHHTVVTSDEDFLSVIIQHE